ncbi:stage II sporulation protein D [Bacillus alkalicellulosilyticus]|uniref:stage II sporulation protein D n=1 Tax=Alkalihalobacterium alkalicellulosilyticum TaxID=1912214 RepID=UPI00099734B3|nr:stage II sporulation protein D [Bacillus alkalicellulosilyticus]
MKSFYILGTIFIIFILVVPSLIVVGFSSDKIMSMNDKKELVHDQATNSEKTVAVYRNETNDIEEVPLEEYIIGVVASEMPATFELEALKAQALAARTYFLHSFSSNDVHSTKEYDITDSVNHQVYKNNAELKEKWGDDYILYMEKIKEAVAQTRGEIITYNGKPILSLYFSSSNGYTENSEDYYENESPYLRSVASPWDKDSPHYEVETVISTEEFEQALGIALDNYSDFGIKSRTKGGNVSSIRIADKEFTGRMIRELLQLKSSDFTITRLEDTISIKTRGNGHGVGMSQYGANGMAKEGFSYKDIIHHYYQSIDIQQY